MVLPCTGLVKSNPETISVGAYVDEKVTGESCAVVKDWVNRPPMAIFKMLVEMVMREMKSRRNLRLLNVPINVAIGGRDAYLKDKVCLPDAAPFRNLTQGSITLRSLCKIINEASIAVAIRLGANDQKLCCINVFEPARYVKPLLITAKLRRRPKPMMILTIITVAIANPNTLTKNGSRS